MCEPAIMFLGRRSYMVQSGKPAFSSYRLKR
jgi:hypothetical protein